MSSEYPIVARKSGRNGTMLEQPPVLNGFAGI
ncbi:hypothetical protein FIV00_29115 [Labrenzia sp. THAF82]|nr:hypothetical protein FIV00_29115 [Labrenzia sp. THAF82]